MRDTGPVSIRLDKNGNVAAAAACVADARRFLGLTEKIMLRDGLSMAWNTYTSPDGRTTYRVSSVNGRKIISISCAPGAQPPQQPSVFAPVLNQIPAQGTGMYYEFLTSENNSWPSQWGSFAYPYWTEGHVTRISQGGSPIMLYSYDGLNGAPTYTVTETNDYNVPNWWTFKSTNMQKVVWAQSYTSQLINGTETVKYVTTPAQGLPSPTRRNNNAGVTGVVPNYSGMGDYTRFCVDPWLTEDVGWDLRMPVYQTIAGSLDYNPSAWATKRALRPTADGVEMVSLQPNLPPPLWWRRGTVTTVTDSNGVQYPITIATDNQSNFYFYRTDLPNAYLVAGSTGELYVPSSSYVKIAASSFLPAWVETPSYTTMSTLKHSGLSISFDLGAGQWGQFGTDNSTYPTSAAYTYVTDPTFPGGDVWAGQTGRQDMSWQDAEYLWKFNAEGTCAAAVVQQNLGNAQYNMPDATQAFGTAAPHDIKIMNWGEPNTWIPPLTESQKASYFAARGGLSTVQLRVRGMLELNISITLSGGVMGAWPVGFTPSISVKRSQQGRYYTDVDYAKNFPAMSVANVNRNDLLVSEIELYSEQPTSVVTVPLLSYGLHKFLTVRNYEQGVDSSPLLRWRMHYANFQLNMGVPYHINEIGNLTAVQWLSGGTSGYGGGTPSPTASYSGGYMMIGPYGEFSLETYGGHPYSIYYYNSVIQTYPQTTPFGGYSGSYVNSDPNAGTSAASPAHNHFNTLVYTVLDGNMPTIGSATVFAQDLSTLSFITGTSGVNPATDRGLQLWIGGAITQRSGTRTEVDLLTFPPITPMQKVPICPDATWMSSYHTAVAAAHTANPSNGWIFQATIAQQFDFYASYTSAHYTMCPHLWLNNLSVHPQGSYSAYCDYWFTGSTIPDPVIDVIVSATNDGKTQTTTHKSVFNSAYNQSRDYNDYAAGGSNQYGQFCTSGMWV